MKFNPSTILNIKASEATPFKHKYQVCQRERTAYIPTLTAMKMAKTMVHQLTSSYVIVDQGNNHSDQFFSSTTRTWPFSRVGRGLGTRLS